jgi:hypothetical protein
MLGRGLRFLTAIMVVGICLPTMSRGWDILRYSVADASPQAARPWFDASGVAFAARDYALTVVDDPRDTQKVRQRRQEIEKILSIRPLSSEYWLSLAKMRQVTGEPSKNVFEALQLSTLTGANESSLISNRGLFGIWQWETLPAELRERTAADLAARRVAYGDLAWLRTTLSEKSETARYEIRTALQAHGFSQNALTNIGL